MGFCWRLAGLHGFEVGQIILLLVAAAVHQRGLLDAS